MHHGIHHHVTPYFWVTNFSVRIKAEIVSECSQRIQTIGSMLAFLVGRPWAPTCFQHIPLISTYIPLIYCLLGGYMLPIPPFRGTISTTIDNMFFKTFTPGSPVDQTKWLVFRMIHSFRIPDPTFREKVWSNWTSRVQKVILKGHDSDFSPSDIIIKEINGPQSKLLEKPRV